MTREKMLTTRACVDHGGLVHLSNDPRYHPAASNSPVCDEPYGEIRIRWWYLERESGITCLRCLATRR